MAGIGNEAKELTPKQVRAITALLSSKDVTSAAKEAGVGERTLYTWLDEPGFRVALKQAEGQAIEAAVRRLSGTAQEAIGVIVAVMHDKSIPAAVRLRAAQSALDQMIKLKQLADLEERVAALEATLEAEASVNANRR